MGLIVSSKSSAIFKIFQSAEVGVDVSMMPSGFFIDAVGLVVAQRTDVSRKVYMSSAQARGLAEALLCAAEALDAERKRLGLGL